MTSPAHSPVDMDLAPLLVEHLRAGRPVRFRAEGGSMSPFLRAGDLATVEPLAPSELTARLRPGDVLLYERRSGVLRLHRFSRWIRTGDAAPALRVRGDAPGQTAEVVLPERVLGVLTSFERDGRIRDPRRPLWRLGGLWWPRVRNRLPFRRAVRRPSPSTAASVALLVEAVRETLRQSPDSAAQAAFASVPEFDTRALATLATQHGVLALCAAALARRIPAAAERLRAATRALAFEGENDLAAVAAVLARLNAAGLRPLVVKGPALGVLAYRDPLLRPFDDVDLLVPPAHRAAAARLLEADGWRDSRGSPALAIRHLLRTTEDLAFRHPDHHVGVELVHPGGILHAAEPGRDAGDLLVPFQVHGVEAAAPSAVEHFLYCAAHGGKHGWTRLAWLVDLDRLSAGFAECDWDRLIGLADRRRLTRLLALGCALAGDLLATPVPARALGRWRGSRWLGHAVERCRAWQSDGVRHAESWRWWLSLQDDLPSRARFLVRWLFRPTGADFRSCLLPLWAHPAYALLRPLRLLWRALARRPPSRFSWEVAPGGR